MLTSQQGFPCKNLATQVTAAQHVRQRNQTPLKTTPSLQADLHSCNDNPHTASGVALSKACYTTERQLRRWKEQRKDWPKLLKQLPQSQMDTFGRRSGQRQFLVRHPRLTSCHHRSVADEDHDSLSGSEVVALNFVARIMAEPLGQHPFAVSA